MELVSDTATSPELIRMVADCGDHAAWLRFYSRYDPHLKRWCRGFGLDADSAEEVCQRIWIEVAKRMRTFHYDPTRTFRGWLRRLCKSRTIDFLRRHNAADGFLGLDDCVDEWGAGAGGTTDDPEEGDPGEADAEGRRFLLFGEADRIQEAVRRKIKPGTWEAFWLVAICDWTVERTAKTLGMTHIAVYAARDRVARMLREEGNRVSNLLKPVS
jgi:RNA polymerase sigma factor (sigma-70 family)